MKRRDIFLALCALALAALVTCQTHPHRDLQLAYIGPGAGFAFLGSFLTLVTSLVLSVVSLLVWPFRMAWLLVSRRQGFRKARIKKLIFLGLDGFDPGLAERFMSEGKLPNLSRLKEQGSYSKLRTTFPALSPVAWSTFATGVNPAKHNIFDFLNRDLKTYVPELSSSKVRPPHRILKLGLRASRLSRPSDSRCGAKASRSGSGPPRYWLPILRVPISFPPDDFNGGCSQPAYARPPRHAGQLHFSTRMQAGRVEGGNRYPLRSGRWRASKVFSKARRMRSSKSTARCAFRSGSLARTIPSAPTLRFKRSWAAQRSTRRGSGSAFMAASGVSVHGIARFY
jgi:hypothetical protein